MIERSRWGYIALGVVILGLGVGLGWLLFHRDISASRVTVVDTVRYYKPQLYIPPASSYRVNVPQFVFAPADTVVKVVVQTEQGDSTKVSFPIEQREYRDSTYRAIVSGAVVGERRPTLDYIETYNRTTTESVVLQPKKVRLYVGGSVGVFGAWSVSAGGGLLIQDHHLVGVEYERTKTANQIELRYGYVF